MKGTVKCDKCDWKTSTEDMESWNNVLCPNCKKSKIIDKEDMVIIGGLHALEMLGIISTDVDNPDKKGIKVHMKSHELKEFIKEHL